GDRPAATPQRRADLRGRRGGRLPVPVAGVLRGRDAGGETGPPPVAPLARGPTRLDPGPGAALLSPARHPPSRPEASQRAADDPARLGGGGLPWPRKSR